MSPEDLRFSTIKEDRDWYYVEYRPPNDVCSYSGVSLSIIDSNDPDSVAIAMETEAKLWLARYPIPVVVTAFNAEDDVYKLENVRPIDHLIAWIDLENKIAYKWDLSWPDGVAPVKLSPSQLKEIFSDIPYKTGFEIKKEANKNLGRLKLGWWVVFAWAVVVPVIVALVEWWSDFLGVLVLGYAFLKALVETLRLTGHLPASKRKKEKEAEELRMRHHHYHCERNPEAFNKLKAENFTRETIESTKREALALKAKASKLPQVD